MVVTDHCPLQAWMSSRSFSRRLQGWALQLQDYGFEVVYRPGCKNGEADALSRQNWSTEDPDEDRGGGVPPHCQIHSAASATLSAEMTGGGAGGAA